MWKGGLFMRFKTSAVLAFLLVGVLLLSICAYANYENDSDERFAYISLCDGGISHGTLSTKVYASIEGNSQVTSVKVKMELQKLSSGDYSTIETWEQTFSGRSGSMDESKLTSPLSTYRLKATLTAYSGSNSESKIIYRYS